MVLIPDGVMFQSAAVLYLLSRALEVSFVGAPVDNDMTDMPEVTGSVVHPSATEARFAVSNGDIGGGAVLVYDYVRKQWCRHLLNENVSGDNASPAIGNAVVAGVYYWIAPNGAAYQESPSSNTDAG